MDKEEIKKQIAKIDGDIYKFDINNDNLKDFRALVEKRSKLETKLKDINNRKVEINISHQVVV